MNKNETTNLFSNDYLFANIMQWEQGRGNQI